MKGNAAHINTVQRLRDAPRCSATAQSARQRCRNPSEQGWPVCGLHGAGASPGKSHLNHKHGMRSKEFTEERKELNRLIRELNEFE